MHAARAARTIRSAALLLSALALCALLAACGYSVNHREAPTGAALPEAIRTVFLDSVHNPTTETWLGPAVRSKLRDELTRRGWTNWADKSHADGLLQVTIVRFTRDSTVRGETDDTLKYTSSVTLSASIVDADTEQVIWSSGDVGWSVSSYASDAATEKEAATQAVELSVRELADKLGQGY